MSKLNQDEVNKRILAKNSPTHLSYELISLENKTCDELYEKYQEKKKKFLIAVQQHQKFNEMLLISDRKCVLDDYILNINCDFLLIDEELNENVTIT